MKKSNPIKKDIKEQKSKFKSLTFSQKVEYIWGYYKYYMLAFVIIVGTIVAFVNSYIRNDYDTVFSVVIADGKMTGYDDQTDALTTGFTEYLGIDGKKTRVEFDYNYTLIQTPLDQDPVYSVNKIYTLASTHSMDGYISERDYIDYFSNDDEIFLYDLRELLTSEELQKLDDYIIYYTMNDGTKIPYALDISDTDVIKSTNLTMDDPCYGIVVSSNQVDNSVAFIRYLFKL